MCIPLIHKTHPYSRKANTAETYLSWPQHKSRLPLRFMAGPLMVNQKYLTSETEAFSYVVL